MRINLKCPYSQKDKARALGARWDPARKVWYVVDVEDLTPFMDWIEEDPMTLEPKISLLAYLGQNYRGAAIGLSMEAAKAFNVPYPLEKGWAKKYGDREITLARMNNMNKNKKTQSFNSHSRKDQYEVHDK